MPAFPAVERSGQLRVALPFSDRPVTRSPDLPIPQLHPSSLQLHPLYGPLPLGVYFRANTFDNARP